MPPKRLVPNIAKTKESVSHHCDLCLRIHSLTEVRLKGLVKKACSDAGRNHKSRYGCPNMREEEKIIIKRVKEFFDELKLQLGNSCRRTIMGYTFVLTALACGVSIMTVRSAFYGTSNRSEHSTRSYQNLMEMTLEAFEEDWKETVCHFAHNELNSINSLTVDDLHKRLSTAYANFPMSTSALLAFLKGLGFTCREVEDKAYIVLEPGAVKTEPKLV